MRDILNNKEFRDHGMTSDDTDDTEKQILGLTEDSESKEILTD